MKVLATIASALLVAAPLVAAAPWHVKVHVHSVKQGLLATCLSPSGGSVACQDDLQCVQVNDEYATCIKKRPEDYDQCGGSSTTGEWKNECVGANTTCVFVSPYFYQCQNLQKREQFRFVKGQHGHKHHHHKGAEKPGELVPLHGQCKWIDSLATCAKDLQCIIENDHYGQCRSTSVKLYEQCAGKGWKDPWSAKCSQGDCVKRDEWYSQCLPTGAGDASKTPPPTSAPGAASAAAKWDQCGGANFHGLTTCVTGTSCVKHNNWYSQCKPDKLPVGELCAEKKGDTNWSHEACEGGAKCVVSNPDQTESRCK